MQAAGIEPEAAFFDKESRSLMFDTGDSGVRIIRVRAFDVATFVAPGAAQALSLIHISEPTRPY